MLERFTVINQEYHYTGTMPGQKKFVGDLTTVGESLTEGEAVWNVEYLDLATCQHKVFQLIA